MISSISRFRAWLLALAVFAAIEGTYWLLARPAPIARSNFLEHRFTQPEAVQRYFAYDKLEALSDRAPTILHVGDSSGFHAAIPPVIEALLPGERYLNFGVATTLGYPGYYAMAQYMLERHRSIHTLVLYASMLCAFPQPVVLADNPQLIGTDLANDLTDPLRGILRPPTLALREQVTKEVYYLGIFRQPDAPRIENHGYRMFRAFMTQVGGWMRETDQADDLVHDIFDQWRQIPPHQIDRACPVVPSTAWDWSTFSRRTHIEIVLRDFAALAARHGAQVVIIPNPVPEGASAIRDGTLPMAELRRVAALHPNMHMAPAEVWPKHLFSVIAHVATPYATLSSERVARVLAPLIPRRGDAPRAEDDATLPDSVELDATRPFSGYAWTEHPDRSGPVAFRATFPGRSEALIHLRVRPGAAYRLSLQVPPDLPLHLREALTVSVFGLRATPHPAEGADRLEFDLPEEAVSRHNGYLEVMLSLRGLTEWPREQTTDRPREELLRFTRLSLQRI